MRGKNWSSGGSVQCWLNGWENLYIALKSLFHLVYWSKDLMYLDKAVFLDHGQPSWKVKRNCLNDLLLFWKNRKYYLHKTPGLFVAFGPSWLQRPCCRSHWKVLKHLPPANFRVLWMARIAQMAGVSNFWSAQVTQDFDKSPFSLNFYGSLLPLWIWSGSSAMSGKASKQTNKKKTSGKFLDT